MEINAETKTRIFTVADQLFKESGGDRFPTVDQVRRAAKCDMNTASSVMKEWRRAQTAQPEKAVVALPSELSEQFQALAQTTYETAQKIANESLDAAKAKWEEERAEAEAMRVEIADAFEAQGDELAAEREAKSELEAELERNKEERAALEAQNADLDFKTKALSEQVLELKAEIATANGKLEQARAAQQNATQAAEIAQAKETAANEKADDFKAQIAELRGVITEIKDELGAARLAAAKAQGEAADSARHVAEVQHEIIAIQKQSQLQLTGEHEKNRELANELSNVREALAKLQASQPAGAKKAAKKKDADA